MIGEIRATLLLLTILCSLLVSLPNITAVRAAEDSWTTMEPMPTARAGIGVAVVGGKIYAIGGSYDSVGETEEYDPATNTWATKTSMPTPRMWLGIAVVENKIYVIGGDSGNWEVGITPTSVNEVYDPATDTWETLTPMPTKRMAVSANVVDGKIYVIGGGQRATNTHFDVNEVYDTETDTWITGTAMPTARYGLGVAIIDDVLYAIGGREGWVGFPISAANEQYTPAGYIPEFPSWAPLLIALVAVVAITFVYRHKLNKQRRFDDI